MLRFRRRRPDGKAGKHLIAAGIAGKDERSKEAIRRALYPLVPAEAGTQLLDSRFRGNERSWLQRSACFTKIGK